MHSINPKPRTTALSKAKSKGTNSIREEKQSKKAEENNFELQTELLDVTDLLHQDHLKVMDLFFQISLLRR